MAPSAVSGGKSNAVEEQPSQDLRARVSGVFFIFFFLSGMCALIYEVAWTRRLTLIFGVTVYSVSTVLVAFMGGLALGSIVFGRIADRRRDPIRIYALLEIGIGIAAFLLPLALSSTNLIYRALYNLAGPSNSIMSLARFVLCAAILIVPTSLMGATLPVLSRFVVRRVDSTGRWIGSLYAVNTLGAVLGCFLAGFVLLGWLGITRSEQLAAISNILIGLTALALCGRLGMIEAPNEEKQAVESISEKVRYDSNALRVTLICFGVSGTLALAYEVLWARILVFLLGSSIYSFSMILVVYLLGLTAGSTILARSADKLKKPLSVFGWLEILIGFSVLAGLFFFRKLPFEEYALTVAPIEYLRVNFLSTAAIVLPPTILMGATFPVAVSIYARSYSAIGRQTGSLYAVNTIGAIAGSFAAGFLLIPSMGSSKSMMLLILLSIACGCVLLYLSMTREGALRLNWVFSGLLIVPIIGFFAGRDLTKELSLRVLGREKGQVIAFKEDATAAVAVVENRTGFKRLAVNGIAMTVLCTETQLMAHLPLALSANPQKVLIICFGMGTTFASARRVGVEVDFVELSPYVVDTFKYFQDDPSMLEEPGVGKIIADGRNYLLLSDESYDLITIDPPPPPWSAGTVNLYTKEFYDLCKEHLTPGGIVCQWLPTFKASLSETQYRMLVRTFVEVFPHTSVWGSPNNWGTYLIGTPERLTIDTDSFDRYFETPAVRSDLSKYAETPINGSRVLSLLLLDEDAVREYVSDAVIMSDDLPLIEFPLFKQGPDSSIMSPEMLLTVKSREK